MWKRIINRLLFIKAVGPLAAYCWGLGPTSDGPEVEIIRFFREHPEGTEHGIDGCLHIV